MKHVIKTQIFEVRQSSKGWSGIWGLFFDKEKALQKSALLKKEAVERGSSMNFRVYEHVADDVLVYDESNVKHTMTSKQLDEVLFYARKTLVNVPSFLRSDDEEKLIELIGNINDTAAEKQNLPFEIEIV